MTIDEILQIPEPALDPEIIAAYIQGTLSPADEQSIDLLLANNPDLQQMALELAELPEPESIDFEGMPADAEIDAIPLPEIDGLFDQLPTADYDPIPLMEVDETPADALDVEAIDDSEDEMSVMVDIHSADFGHDLDNPYLAFPDDSADSDSFDATTDDMSQLDF